MPAAANRATLPLSLICLSFLTAPGPALAQQWAPERNIEFIVPTSAGSTMDLLARVMQKIWQDEHAVNVSMTVEAKPGAGGALAWGYVSSKTGDGHVIAISGPTLLSNDILHVGNLSYNDVTPIAQLFTEYEVFAVKAGSPIKSGSDLIKAMKSSSPLSIGVAPGVGGSSHVAILKLARVAQIDPKSLIIVPFKGANESVNNVLGGHIDVSITTMSAIAPFLKAGKMRAVALAAPKRIDGVDIPTWHELGYDVVEGNWRGIIGPKNLDKAELAYWDKRVSELVKTAAWAEMLNRYQWEADYADSSESQHFLDMRYQELQAIFANLKLAK